MWLFLKLFQVVVKASYWFLVESEKVAISGKDKQNCSSESAIRTLPPLRAFRLDSPQGESFMWLFLKLFQVVVKKCYLLLVKPEMIAISGMNKDATMNKTTPPRKIIMIGSIIFIIPSVNVRTSSS